MAAVEEEAGILAASKAVAALQVRNIQQMSVAIAKMKVLTLIYKYNV